MKHIYAAVALVVLLMPILSVSASTVVRTGETVSIGADQSVTGSFYGVGGTVVTSGQVEGDAVLIGGTVTLNGEVTDDVLVFGGTVGVYSPAGASTGLSLRLTVPTISAPAARVSSVALT